MRASLFSSFALAVVTVILSTAAGVLAEGGPSQRSSRDLDRLLDYATTRYLKYRREVDRNVSDPLMIPLNIVGTVFGVAWVSRYPAEWLYWEDVVQPLRARHYVPDFVPGYRAVPDASPTLAVFVQYAGAQYPSVQDDSSEPEPASLEIDGFSALLPGEHKHVWIRSQVRESNRSRVCLVVVQAVRRDEDGRMGTIRAVETRVLESLQDSGEFRWTREDSSWRFIPDH